MRRIIPLFLFLAACASMDKKDANATVVEGFGIDSKRCEALKDRKEFVWGEWPEDKWWEIFQDPALGKLVETALAENFSLHSVAARVRRAKAESDMVRSKLLPQLDAIFNVMWTYLGKEVLKVFPNLSSNFQFYTGALTFNYEFDFWGKNQKMFAAALGEVAVQNALYQQAKISLSVTLALQYYQLQATAAKMRMFSELLENRKKQLELIVLRNKYQIDNTIDINKIKGEVIALQESLAAIKEALEMDKSALLTLIGKNPTDSLDVPICWHASHCPFELPKEIGMNLLARRADLSAEMARVKKSANLVGVAITEFYPNISLGGFAGLLSPEWNGFFSAKGVSAGMLPMLQLPIFHGGKIRANLREKIATYEMQVEEYNDLLINAANEVVSGITRLMGVNEQIGYHTEQVAVLRQNYELTDLKYREGITSLLTTLQVKEKWLWMEMQQIELERMKYESVILLVKALGGGFGSE